MMTPKFFILLSFLIMSVMIGGDAAEANLEIILPNSSDIQTVEKKELPEGDEDTQKTETAPQAQSDEEERKEAEPLSAQELPEISEPEPKSEAEDTQAAPVSAEDDGSDVTEDAEGKAEEDEDTLEIDDDIQSQPDEMGEAEESAPPQAQEAPESRDTAVDDNEPESVPEGDVQEREPAPASDEIDKSDTAEELGPEEAAEESLGGQPYSPGEENVEGKVEEKSEETFIEEPEALPDDALKEQKSPLSFGLLFDVESGDMTYTIQGEEDGGWKSELEWPLDKVMYAGAEASLNFREKWRVRAEFLKSVTDDAGTLKDSDWFYGYYNDQVAVYSETSTTIDAYHFDLSLGYRFVQKTRISFGGLIGYGYKHWDWTGGDGYQWTIDPFSHYQGPITGPAIAYTQDVYVPYLGLELAFLSGNSKIGADISALYSPVAVCKDESDHLLREKKGEGDTSGNFFALRGNARWNLNARWSLGVRASMLLYDLDGDQTQYFYGGENAGTGVSGIDMNVKGTQTYLGLTLGYSL